MELMESWWTGGSAELGIQGVAGAEEAGRWLALSVGVFGTLVMHSPKVPHPDFSVQVVRHNLGKYFAVENFGSEKSCPVFLP
jgi:hypothetical protein